MTFFYRCGWYGGGGDLWASTSIRSAGPGKREVGGLIIDVVLVVAVCRAGGRGFTLAREGHGTIPFYNVSF